MDEAENKNGSLPEQPKEPFTPRPVWHRVLAWILIGIVLFAFLGTCHWMVNYK